MPRKGHNFHGEQQPLLSPLLTKHGKKYSGDAASLVSSHFSGLGGSAIGERMEYNDYTTVDWLHDLVRDSYRHRYAHSGKGIRGRLVAYFDSASGWIAAIIMGVMTAFVGLAVDNAEATFSDWKFGACRRNPLLSRASCCQGSSSVRMPPDSEMGVNCDEFRIWSQHQWTAFAIYGAFAVAFGLIACGLTLTTKAALPAAAPSKGMKHAEPGESLPAPRGKFLYMASGSGIPELKTILSGFVIPHFLGLKVLLVKAVGAAFAVSSNMCIGKEGPFVHISACVGNLVAMRFTKFRTNSRKYREIMAAALAAGISAAFGAPIGGVLFAYEEVATYFPRTTLWRAFLCSAFAAIILKTFNPEGEGKLMLYETHYGVKYLAQHYAAFILIGVAGGVWGGLFCRLSDVWGKWFRSFSAIKKYPMFEVLLVVLVSVAVQYPNPLTRVSGERVIKNSLVDCSDPSMAQSWICRNEGAETTQWAYVGWLVHGCLSKLVLTIAAHGTKVPSGLIIPALGGGAFFGRLLGQSIDTISPGIFAMVGAGAFLAGISKMTISLCVIMLELTGELRYILPHMIAIMVAKWTSDLFSADGIYDLTQATLGHPFLDTDKSMRLIQRQDPPHTLRRLVPSMMTMDEMTVTVDKDNKVSRALLETKLEQLKCLGLLDGGLVLLQNGGALQGFLGENELEFGLQDLGQHYPKDGRVRLLGQRLDGLVGYSPQDEERDPLINQALQQNGELDLSRFVDRTPIGLCEVAPMEFVLETFAKLGVRHIIIHQEGTGLVVGVVSKKRMLAYQAAVLHALRSGYRHIDGARIYGTEPAVANAMRDSGVPRSDIFLTTKLWNNSHAPASVEKACDASLKDLKTDYLDLYLMHWPCAFADGDVMNPDDGNGNRLRGDTDYVDTWAAMENLVSKGKVKAIGISNFSKGEVERLLQHAKIKPAVHQVELHPYLQQKSFMDFHQQHNIHVTQYSPFGNRNDIYSKGQQIGQLIEDPVILDIAKKHNKTGAQVTLAWGIQTGNSVIPKSKTPSRIDENISLPTLDEGDMQKIAGIDKRLRFNDPSARFGWNFSDFAQPASPPSIVNACPLAKARRVPYCGGGDMTQEGTAPQILQVVSAIPVLF
ncbi:MAG: hypothetical protein Q9159_001507 [Coniocarpon cinnabarinum]